MGYNNGLERCESLVESARLESACPELSGPWVQIPPSPPLSRSRHSREDYGGQIPPSVSEGELPSSILKENPLRKDLRRC